MYITFCGATFNTISSPIDTFESLIWTQRWYEPGAFKIVMPTSHFTEADAAVFIYNSDVADYMLIDDVQIDSESNTLIVTGSSLESMFDSRPMHSPTYYSAHIEDTARNYVWLFATGDVIASNAFINTPITLATAKNYTDSASAQTAIGVLLSDAIQRIYKPLGWTYTLKRSPGTANLIFDTAVGLDRRSAQSVNQRAMFMSSKGDIASYFYSKNKKDYRNYVFMRTAWPYSSAGSIADGVSTREYNAVVTGDERRIVFLEGNVNYSTAAMDALCKAELTKYPVVENATGEISPGCSLIYGTDYSLGDYCDFIISDIGLSFSAQVTAVDFVYEKGAKRIVPIWGEEKLNPRRFIKREAGK